MADDRLDKLSEIHNGGLCNYKGSKEELVTLFGKISRIFWYFKKKKAQTEQFLWYSVFCVRDKCKIVRLLLLNMEG